MWIDQTAAQQLQRLWERNPREEYLCGLYRECARIARVHLASLARNDKRELSEDRLRELSHQAAARLICRYRRRPDYRVVSFWKVVWHEARHAYYDGGHKDRGKQQVIRNQVALEAAYDVPAPGQVEDPAPEDHRKDILADHPIGWMIERDLRTAKTYRQAIERIARYVGRRWIYDHAVQLRYVYRVWKVRA